MTKSYNMNSMLGMRNTKTYAAWANMLSRCKTNPNYVKKGISVTSEWNKFSNFYADMGECPEGLQLDRKDNVGNYCKDNCRWVTRQVNMQNSSATKLTEYQVTLIRALLAARNPKFSNSYGYSIIGDLFKVNRTTIQRIATGQSW